MHNYWGKTRLFDISEFLENYNFLESYNNIFEDTLPEEHF